jgi:hypothetical protein
MLFVGALAGTWFLMIFGDFGGFWITVSVVIAVGIVVLALFGWAMDALRVPRRAWWIPWPIIAALICVSTIRSYPSYQRAISKNGSLQTYVLFSMNFSLYFSAIGLLAIAPLFGWQRRPPPPGFCQGCGYDLTGNTSGMCPECGENVYGQSESDHRGAETQRRT